MTTPYPTPQKGKPPNNASDRRRLLAMRLNRAANELNPFLMIVAVGLLILNLTFYLGMSVSRHPAAASAAHGAVYYEPGNGLSTGAPPDNAWR